MPCGCVNPKYDMRFVGWKDGRLIKGAPKIPRGTIQKNFIEEATLPHWELVEPLPAIKKVPRVQKDDSVYEDVKEIKGEETEKPEEDPDEIELMTVKDLQAFIKRHGGTVDPTWLKSDLVMEARKYAEETVEHPEE